MFSFFKKDKNSIYAPATGRVVKLEEVKDQAFASGAMGDGIAIDPEESVFRAPADGKITLISDTKHAFGMELDSGIELLVHIGLDTVKFQGEGFKVLVKEGDIVKKGTPVIEVDLHFFKEKGVVLESPVIILDDAGHTCKILSATDCKAGVTKLVEVN